MSDAPRWPGADGSPGLDFSRPKTDTVTPPPNEAPATMNAGVGGRSADGVSAPPAPSDLDVDITQQVPKIDGQKAPAVDERPSFGFDRPDGPPKLRQQDVDFELDSITRSASPKPGPDYQAKSTDVGAPAAPAPGLRQEAPTPVGAAAEPAPARAVRTTETTTTTTAPRTVRRTRKARLRLHRIDPWSVMKTAFLFSFAFGVMLVAAVAVLWSVFAGSDTMTYINDFVNSIMAGEQGGARFDINDYLGWQRVLGLTTVLAVIDVVIFTAVATLFAFLYNLSAVIMGGLEVTLAED